ncbi:hypothetical protein [Erwinia piriflorinigrans]|uniref:Uncharacterized protein n=1 Tax=Erwinia piriflorinigrans CFBP 5888 TaxID=1161919 RepID=V5ZBY3_9GAMM|nr:hypothetical protein [Erwinia piriflorinigrans]CCG88517.1 hypothetical protein EPIR_3154 [Erwinia piriflorinigrans CFBP 5888]
MRRQLSMHPGINLVVSDPDITLDAFCRCAGYKIACARQTIREGRLPIGKKAGVNGLVEVNMVALPIEASPAGEIPMQE